MASERRAGDRVVFERGFAAHLMVEGLNLKEFFLLLSSTGLAYRRCELAWVNGEQIGAGFLKPEAKKKPSRRTSSSQVVEV